MKSIVFSLLMMLLILGVMAVFGAQPPFHVEDPAIQSDFEEIYHRLATHQHNNDGSVRLSTTAINDFSTAVSSTTNISNIGSFANRVINGNMEVSQRLVTSSSRPVAAGEFYGLDGFLMSTSVGNRLRVVQSTDGPDLFPHSSSVSVAAGIAITSGRTMSFQTKIEGFDIADLNWGTSEAESATLSFWVKASSAGTFGLSFANGSVDRVYAASYTITSAATWQSVTVTVPGDTSGTWANGNSVGAIIRWSLGAGSTFQGTAGAWGSSDIYEGSGYFHIAESTGAYFLVTGVQFEKGDTAHDFGFQPFQVNLARCQRYYEKSYELGTVPGNSTGVGGSGGIRATGSFFMPVTFRVSKRSVPAMTIYSTSGAVNAVRNNRTGADEVVTDASQIGQNGGNLSATSATVSDGFSYQWTADASL